MSDYEEQTILYFYGRISDLKKCAYYENKYR